MKTGPNMKNRQGGAVAVMVGFSLVLLIGFLAMVIDLGHLYVAKTELQNGADAAALAGAKELNGTADGVTSAISKAVDLANRNNYDFSKPVATTAADLDIWVCSSPDSCTVLASTAAADATNATAADKTFLKVHTRNRDLVAWFAPIWNIFKVSTYGMAVAGRYVTDVMPLGVCAVQKSASEYGFIRGVAYNIPDLNPLGATAVPMWINPVDIPPATCDPNHASNDFAVPYVCTGKSAIDPSAKKVYVSTGTQAALNKPLNVRFASTLSDYNGTGCNYGSALPDVNIRKYSCTNEKGKDGCLKDKSADTTGLPLNWMNPDPIRQTVWFGDDKDEIAATVKSLRNGTLSLSAWRSALTATQWGVLWSYNKEVKDFSTLPYTYYDTTNWSTLYSTNTTTSYPTPSPYAANGTNFFKTPTTLTGSEKRRILNILIIDCPDMTGSNAMSCKELPVLGVGQFFMQVEADVPTYLGVEFAGLIPKPFPPSNIRLYE